MTWGVFLLYAHDTYPEEVYQQVAEYTVNSMIGSRGFVRFEEFAAELMRLYKTDLDQPIAELYPGILEWAREN